MNTQRAMQRDTIGILLPCPLKQIQNNNGSTVDVARTVQSLILIMSVNLSEYFKEQGILTILVSLCLATLTDISNSRTKPAGLVFQSIILNTNSEAEMTFYKTHQSCPKVAFTTLEMHLKPCYLAAQSPLFKLIRKLTGLAVQPFY